MKSFILVKAIYGSLLFHKTMCNLYKAILLHLPNGAKIYEVIQDISV